MQHYILKYSWVSRITMSTNGAQENIFLYLQKYFHL